MGGMMALGCQQADQPELLVTWAEMPRSPGHVSYDRLQEVLTAAGFDVFAEAQCAPFYAARRGRPSLPLGRYSRMHLVGYFVTVRRTFQLPTLIVCGGAAPIEPNAHASLSIGLAWGRGGADGLWYQHMDRS